MENPNTWKTLEKVIDKAIREHDEFLYAGGIGGSKAKEVADKIRGKLNDIFEEELNTGSIDKYVCSSCAGMGWKSAATPLQECTECEGIGYKQ